MESLVFSKSFNFQLLNSEVLVLYSRLWQARLLGSSRVTRVMFCPPGFIRPSSVL